MNNEMRSVIENILSVHGAEVFYNMHRANAVLLDMAAFMPRERILVRSLVEADGFRLLESAGETYPLVINRLIKTLTELFCIDYSAAAWVTYTVAGALGYDVEYNPNEHINEGTALVHRGGSLVAMGMAHIVAVATDGTVYFHGMNEHYQTDVKSWKNISAVAAGVSHTVGLKADGTVFATGLNASDQCDVGFWSDIASIHAFGHDTVGVRSDGTVLSAGRSRFALAHFNDIKNIAKAPIGIFGITDEGKVLFSDLEPDEDTEEEVRWLNSLPGVSDIISHARECIALCADGHIYKYRENPGYFSQWRDVVSIIDLNDCFAVLRADGTVRVLHFDREKPRADTAADLWTDVVSIYGNYGRLVGLKKSGSLSAAYISLNHVSAGGIVSTRAFGNFEFLNDWTL